MDLNSKFPILLNNEFFVLFISFAFPISFLSAVLDLFTFPMETLFVFPHQYLGSWISVLTLVRRSELAGNDNERDAELRVLHEVVSHFSEMIPMLGVDYHVRSH